MNSFNILEVIIGNIKVNRATIRYVLEVIIVKLSYMGRPNINNGLNSNPMTMLVGAY
jgi:hypothetical protein